MQQLCNEDQKRLLRLEGLHCPQAGVLEPPEQIGEAIVSCDEMIKMALANKGAKAQQALA